MTLAAAGFPDFFAAIHGHRPFPWQERLAGQVLGEGLPSTLALPTASGKTAILDIAVFALAAQAHLPLAQRRVGRRIALVVDRRIVVDDAYRRAERIADRLAVAKDGVLRAVADALRALGGDSDRPLDTALLRGGIYREDRWARTPSQPVLLCSTVDQVGSRLLHRGYGLSSSAWPIHAGLLGNDSLIVLDEAHCSRPFLQTLAQLARFRGQAERPLASPFAWVAMTATPHHGSPPFELDAADRRHPVLQPRLQARKPARLHVIDRKTDFTTATVDAIREALAWTDGPAVHSVLVVLNRVQAARDLRERLRTLALAHRDGLAVDSILLTGRCRGLERDELLNRWRERIMAGRDMRHPAEAKPLIVVATQCVEVGADLDLDALVTEACPLDALRQRLGRIDRLGQRNVSPVTVLCRLEHLGTDADPADDPIYGQALSRTWRWLQNLPEAAGGCRDLGIDGLGPHLLKPDSEVMQGLSTPALDAPIIFPAYCDLWTQTGPEPAVSPDPAVFLHGPQRRSAEIHLVWRVDLDPQRPDGWADVVGACPPLATETLTLPLYVARAWLSETSTEDHGGDLDEAQPVREEEPAAGSRPALRWRGPDHPATGLVAADALRPGDTLVVPCSYGGCDAEGWHGAAGHGDTVDIAELARLRGQRPAILRLHASVLAQPAWAHVAGSLHPLAVITDEDAWPEDLSAQVAVALRAATAAANHDATGIGAVLRTLADDDQRNLEPHPSGTGLIVTSRHRLGREASDEDDGSSRGAAAVPLLSHLEDVRAWAAHLATRCGLAQDLAADVALAGHLHDLGKADPRFQAWLAGGDRLRAARHGLLAKSRLAPTSPARMRQARLRSGYPEGGRHELLSVRLAESHPGLKASAHDWELVLHLVASHHGRCRPFAPVVADAHPMTVSMEFAATRPTANSATGLERLDSGVADRFWTLIRRYGWWGLAYLETCLRLADHRASESPGKEHRP